VFPACLHLLHALPDLEQEEAVIRLFGRWTSGEVANWFSYAGMPLSILWNIGNLLKRVIPLLALLYIDSRALFCY
jgi:hypothetical protein